MEIILRPGEKVELDTSISPRLFILLIAVGITLILGLPGIIISLAGIFGVEDLLLSGSFSALVALVIGGGLILYAFYFRAARHYLVTNQRVVYTIGWISKRTIFAEYGDITDISIRQDPFERFVLNSGTVEVNTAGTDTEDILLERIDRPYNVATKIRELCELRMETNGHKKPHAMPSLHAGPSGK